MSYQTDFPLGVGRKTPELKSGMKGELFMVTHPRPDSASMNYWGRVGTSKYNSVKEAYKHGPHSVVLIFGDDSSVGFRLSELTHIPERKP